MTRLDELTPLWSWLPAFRAVAETEHLPTAAELLGVGPSALSRSVRLLERAVGAPLFERKGRSLVLTPRGKEFLVAVRDSMRRLHDGLVAARDDAFRGPLRIASGGAMTTAFVVPAVLEMCAAHPELRPAINSPGPAAIPELLLQGAIDVAFRSEHVRSPELTTLALGDLTAGVYCGPDHPLAGRRDVDLATIVAHDFVGPEPTPDGSSPDGWPDEHERRVVLHVDQMRVGSEVCRRGALLAVLPDAMATADELVRLPVDIVPNAPMFAVRRTVLGPEPSPVGELIERVTSRIAGDASP